MELYLTLNELYLYGGALIVLGGIIATVAVNRASISRLWDLKQDIKVCEIHTATVTRIEKKLDAVLRINGVRYTDEDP